MMLINGKPEETVSALDRGLQYGDGVFETLKVIDGSPQLWLRHMARLKSACDKLGLAQPDKSLLLQESRTLSEKQPNGVLKIIITRGAGGRGYRPPNPAKNTRIVAIYPELDYPAELWQEGVEVCLCQTRLARQPGLAGIKHLNRLEQILASGEWQHTSCFEGLMCDTEGNAIEGTMSNIFIVYGTQVATPDLTECGVAGIMREVIIELIQQADFQLSVRPIPKEEVLAADEMFLSNSVIGLLPVRNIGDKHFKMGYITGKVQSLLENYLTKHEKQLV